jgi:hypothetical protein
MDPGPQTRQRRFWGAGDGQRPVDSHRKPLFLKCLISARRISLGGGGASVPPPPPNLDGIPGRLGGHPAATRSPYTKGRRVLGRAGKGASGEAPVESGAGVRPAIPRLPRPGHGPDSTPARLRTSADQRIHPTISLNHTIRD